MIQFRSLCACYMTKQMAHKAVLPITLPTRYVPRPHHAHALSTPFPDPWCFGTSQATCNCFESVQCPRNTRKYPYDTIQCPCHPHKAPTQCVVLVHLAHPM